MAVATTEIGVRRFDARAADGSRLMVDLHPDGRLSVGIAAAPDRVAWTRLSPASAAELAEFLTATEA